MIDDYETIDFRSHYEATKDHDERITQLEKKLKQLENTMGLK